MRGVNLMAMRPDGRLAPKFNQIVLAAPDIRAADFESMVLPAVASGHRGTNYVASDDEALKVSKKINAGPRAGDSGRSLVLVRGVQTIDVSAVNMGLLGHSGFAESKRVLSDIAEQLTGCSPEQRQLQRVPQKDLVYWRIR
jgi:esterase/lipase superfamily enzyme